MLQWKVLLDGLQQQGQRLLLIWRMEELCGLLWRLWRLDGGGCGWIHWLASLLFG